jgi:hypothetical protein
MSRPTKTETAIRAEKEELRKRIEHDPQLKKDFDFLIGKSGLQPNQLLTGLWLDCNLMKADRQTLLSKEKEELWPIDEDTLKRSIKNIRRAADQIETTNETKFSPALTKNIGDNFAGLPEILRSYARELERKVNLWTPYWKRKKSRIPNLVRLTRQHSLYERVRSSAGGYHQIRLLRLVNAARENKGLRKIELRAFTMWLNKFEKRRKEYEPTLLKNDHLPITPPNTSPHPKSFPSQ